jgi:hypothetical protein
MAEDMKNRSPMSCRLPKTNIMRPAASKLSDGVKGITARMISI